MIFCAKHQAKGMLLQPEMSIGVQEKIFRVGAQLKLPEKWCFLKYAHYLVDDQHFATCFYLLHNMLNKK